MKVIYLLRLIKVEPGFKLSISRKTFFRSHEIPDTGGT